MNKIIAFICCLVISKAALAQKDSLAFDDHGKYIYYRVVNMDNYNADTLFNRGVRFFNDNNIKNQFGLSGFSAREGSITGNGKVTIYKPSLAKHPEGQVSFTLKMEVKGSKYRYWLTDLEYHAATRDRYNNYIFAKDGLPLEKKSVSISSKDLDLYLNETASAAILLGNKLKKGLTVETEKKVIRLDTTRRVIHIEKW